MAFLISVDPGTHSAGVACWDDDELTSAWLSVAEDWRMTAFQVFSDLKECFPIELIKTANLILEIPQVYTQNKLKGDPNDLVDVASMASCLAGAFGPEARVMRYWPADWKGQVPKVIMTNRIKEKLSKDERARVELPSAKGLQHNVWDAIGIGLYHLRGRRGRRVSNQSQNPNSQLRSRTKISVPQNGSRR